MLETEHFPGATQSGLDFIGYEQRAVFATKLLRPNKEIGLRCLAAFALDCFDRKRRDVPRTQLSIQLIKIVERHAGVESFHQRAETFGKTFAAHQRERTEAEPLKPAPQSNAPLPSAP